MGKIVWFDTLTTCTSVYQLQCLSNLLQKLQKREDRIKRKKPNNIQDLETLSDIHFQVSLLIKEVVQEGTFHKVS